MSPNTLVPEMEGAVGEGIVSDVEVSIPVEGPGPMVRVPDFSPCYNYAESVNPLFDPRRVLLRRTFFINEDCSKYLSVWLLPGPRLSTLGGSGRLEQDACSSRGGTRADIR